MCQNMHFKEENVHPLFGVLSEPLMIHIGKDFFLILYCAYGFLTRAKVTYQQCY